MKDLHDRSDNAVQKAHALGFKKLMSSQRRTIHQLLSSGILGNGKAAFLSFLSGSYHLLFFKANKFVSPLESGMLIMSIDVDVGSKDLGVINDGKNDANISHRMSEYEIGEIEEEAVPEFAELLSKYEMPATFAIRGQLTEIHDSALVTLQKSKVKHDIGAHGYYHRKFRTLSYDEAETEIKMISQGMQRFRITPKSFVFPRNSVAYLKLLEKYGYECYRDHSNFLNDSMRIQKHGELWEVHSSFFVDKHTKFTFLRKILDVAVERRLPMHLWFHMRDFGDRCSDIKRNSERIFHPLLDYADRKERDGVLTFETMLSAARKACASQIQPVNHSL